MRSRSACHRPKLGGILCAACVLAGIAVGSAGGQDSLPNEVKVLPRWQGEAAARSLKGQYVFRGRPGEIVVYWPDPSDQAHWVTYRFWLQNRVVPEIQANVGRSQDLFVYRYTMGNGPKAESVIWSWSLVGPSDEVLKVSHSAWKGSKSYAVGALQAMLPGVPKGVFLFWMRGPAPAIEPGGELAGFEVDSSFLPGLTTAYAIGEGGLLKPPAEFTEEVERQVIPLELPHVMMKTSVTIGPRFAPGTTLATILRAYQEDIHSLVKEGMLDGDSAFVGELTRSLSSGIRSPQDYAISFTGKPLAPLEREIGDALILAAGAARRAE